MGEESTEGRGGQEGGEFDRDTIERAIRERVRHIIEEVVAAELESARTDRDIGTGTGSGR